MIVIVHGGAGLRRPSKKALERLGESLCTGYAVLRRGGSAVDAVVEAIASLEDSGAFNAGAGSNLQLDGVRRLDASLMEGSQLMAGSVVGVEGIANPIRAALAVMRSPHVIMTNVGVSRIARKEGLRPLPLPSARALARLERIRKGRGEVGTAYRRYFCTVGAVALDGTGGVAAGASTGGIAAMLPGRVGDTPVIGAGVYADDGLGAVSCTGMGESILRVALAKEVSMRLGSASPAVAARAGLRSVLRIGGDAGVIVVSPNGRYTVMHSSAFMASGVATGRGVRVGQGGVTIARDRSREGIVCRRRGGEARAG